MADAMRVRMNARVLGWPVLLVAVGLVLALAAGASARYQMDTTVFELPGSPFDVVVDQDSAIAYVSVPSTDTVLVLDIQRRSLIESWSVPGARGMDINTDGTELYVAQQGERAIAIVDTTTGSLVQEPVFETGNARVWDVVAVGTGSLLVVAASTGTSTGYAVLHDVGTDTSVRVAGGLAMADDPRVTISDGGAHVAQYDSATQLLTVTALDGGSAFDVADSVSVFSSEAVTAGVQVRDDGEAVIAGGKVFLEDFTRVETLRAGSIGFSPRYPERVIEYDARWLTIHDRWATALERYPADCEFGRATTQAFGVGLTNDVIVGSRNMLCIVHLDETSVAPMPAGGRYFDDDGNPHEEAIEALARHQVTEGCRLSRRAYCPADIVTRGQMASFLVRATEIEPGGTSDGNNFDDIANSAHYAEVNAVAAAGVTNGCAPRLYCPDAEVTRAQMASFLARAFDLAPTTTDYFADDTGSVHEDNINAVAEAGITLGCATGVYCPAAPVRRDHMASFLARALGLELAAVPPRELTYDGEFLDIVALAVDQCLFLEEGAPCKVNGGSITGPFYVQTGWYLPDFENQPAADQQAFLSNGLGITTVYDRVPIEFFEFPYFIDEAGSAVRLWAYQFPGWIEHGAVIEVTFFDRTATPDFEFVVETLVLTSGIGFPNNDPLGAVRMNSDPTLMEFVGSG